LIVVVVLLVTVPTLYVFTQVRTETTAYSVSVATSCPRGTWKSPAPGENTGACDGMRFLPLPDLAEISGTWVASNDSPVWVVFDFWGQSYTNTSDNGSFRLSGMTPFTWQAVPSLIGSGGGQAGIGTYFLVVSSFAIAVTINGTYSVPPL
jgi:hypothetical protein